MPTRYSIQPKTSAYISIVLIPALCRLLIYLLRPDSASATGFPATSHLYADPAVMEFFPAPLTPSQSEQFIEKMQAHFEQHQFCYFAVDLLASNEFIGFIGLYTQTFPAPFTPCVDIGWRLSPLRWNQGLASEGAQKCLDYAFEQLQIPTVHAVAPCLNTKSQRVMQKIGMTQQYQFLHPALADSPHLQNCVLYSIDSPTPQIQKQL